MPNHRRTPQNEPGIAAPLLTRREQTILELLGDGKRNKEISGELAITERTVKFHVSALLAKLGATNRTQAVRLGVRRGLIRF
jgi:DNA-binding NarL/FixJ family response regulator